MPRGSAVLHPLVAANNTARRHELGATCVARTFYEQGPQRRLQLRELSQRRPRPVDDWKKMHELAGDLRSTQLSWSLVALGVVAHRVPGEDFLTPLNFRSEESG